MTEKLQWIISGAGIFERAVILAFGVVFTLRFISLLLFRGRILFLNRRRIKADKNKTKESVSLIMTVRNDESEIRRNMPRLLQIRDALYEVVAVDDFSQDNSLSVLGVLRKENHRLKITALNQEIRYSVKMAQNLALKAAGNDWVMVVPPSVVEFNPEWLPFMTENFHDKNVVTGYSTVVGNRNIFNRLFRVESFLLYCKSAGFILNGLPFVYNEENIAFRKAGYFSTGGYGVKIKEPFANLELLLNEFMAGKTTQVLFHKSAVIRKSEATGRSEFMELLKKSFRIEKNLSVRKRLVLFLEESSHLLLLPLLLLLILLLPGIWPVIAGMTGLLLLLWLFIIKISLNHLNERKIFLSSLLYDIFMPYFKFCYRLYFNRHSRKQTWRIRS